MRYWWVNQNQTYQQEVGGGYMWSPKRAAGNRKNFSYEMMREIAPGDLILSFYQQHIAAVGIARTYCYDNAKPEEFGNRGAYWDNKGWRIDVAFNELNNKIKPSAKMNLILPVLPSKYSPLQNNGRGNQIYLTEITNELMSVLAMLIGDEVKLLIEHAPSMIANPLNAPYDPLNKIAEWEEHEITLVETSSSINETEKENIIKSRRGQGLFRKRVSLIEGECRITKVNNPEHLIASHIKPWRHAENEQRLDEENGLFLTPHIDHLFDRGFISFEDNGKVIVAPRTDLESLVRMKVDTKSSVGSFSSGQKEYLDYHRNYVLLQSQNR